MTSTCYTCGREAEFSRLPPREAIAYDNQQRVAHATGTSVVGWLVLVPRRHVMELSNLREEESASLGHWQVRLARALGDELGTSKTYIAEFGEAPGFHLHFHVIPRSVDLAPALRGPGVFGLLGQDDDSAASRASRTPWQQSSRFT